MLCAVFYFFHIYINEYIAFCCCTSQDVIDARVFAFALRWNELLGEKKERVTDWVWHTEQTWQITREKKHNRAYSRNMFTGIAYKNGKRCVCGDGDWWSALASPACVGERRRYYRFSELNESMSFPFSCRTPFFPISFGAQNGISTKKKQTNRNLWDYPMLFRSLSLSRGILHFMYNAK